MQMHRPVINIMSYEEVNIDTLAVFIFHFINCEWRRDPYECKWWMHDGGTEYEGAKNKSKGIK